MEWKKLGFVIKPNPQLWWMKSHCMVPSPMHLEGSIYRLYFSSRNDQNQSHIGYVVIDAKKPNHVIEYSKEPVLSPGQLGCFDDNGVTPSCLIKNGNEVFMYYIGWNPGSTTRMHIYGGLAISHDNGLTFERYSRAPILERNRVNPFINTAPFAIKENNRWLMYYVSGVEWIHKDLPRYHIQIAESQDGKNWLREGKIAIDFIDDENALARPYVIREEGKYKMFFSSKGDSHPDYRMRYAESVDGLKWKRVDNFINLDPSQQGPDSEMVTYGAVIEHDGKKIIYYNGNGYGVEGILVAEEIK
jgi:predicted GH43/DUF377 family glycosyl hydrolase